MKYLLWIFFILMLANVYAVCESGQIDLNSASLEKLDELSGIGPVKAQAIIDTRHFDSVDDLIDVYGIGEATLQKIKEQGLACVEEEEEEDLAPNPDATGMTSENGGLMQDGILGGKEPISIQEKNVELEIITLNSLNSKDIKSEDDKKILDKSDWAKYGFIGFCVLLVFLFILKKPKIPEID